MSDKETFGVELELVTNKFSQKLESIKNKIVKFGNDAKKNLATGLHIDTNDSEKELNRLKEQYNSLFNKITGKNIDIGFDSLGNFEIDSEKLSSFSKAIEDMSNGSFKKLNDLHNLIKGISNDLNTMNTSKLAKLGNILSVSFKNAKNAIGSIPNSLKNAFKGMEEFDSKVKSTFKDGINNIKRFALSLFGIHSIWRAVSRASSSYLSQDVELSNKLQAVWIGLGSMLSPILEKLANIFLKLVSYFNAFIKGITGVDLLAKAMDKANQKTKATSKSVKALKGQLSGFDEINNIDDSSDKSNDIGWVDAFKNVKINTEWAEKIEGFGKWIKDNWKTIVKAIVAIGVAFLAWKLVDFIKNIGSAKDGVSSLGTSFTGFFDGLGKAAEAIAVLGGLALVINSITDLIDTFSQSGMSLKEVAGLLGIVLGELAATFVVMLGAMTALSPGWDSIAAAAVILGGFALVIHEVSSLLKIFSDTGMTVGEVAGLMAAIFVPIVALMGSIALLGPAMTAGLIPFLAVVGGISAILVVMALTLPTILDAVGDFIVKVAPSLIAIMEKIFDFIEKIVDLLGKTLIGIIKEVGNVFDTIFNGISKIINTVGNTMVKIFDSIGGLVEKVLKSILNFIKELGPAINKFVDNAISAVTKLINFIVSGIEYLVNRLVVDGVNAIIDGINKIGKYVGFTIPNVKEFKIARFVPKLDVGTNYVPNDQLAYIHKGEAVVPKKFNSSEFFERGNDETNELLRTLITTLEEKDFDVNLDGKKIGQSTVNYINSQNRILGRSVI